MGSEFPSLQDHSLFHIITHINEYSPDNELALLPRHLRILLLQSVAPVHLVWLEKTAVAAGVDTDSVWGSFLQNSDNGLHRVWLSQEDDRLSQLQAAPRDLYVSYIYQKLFAKSQTLVQFGAKCLPLAVFLYGLSESVVGEGILKIVQNSPSSLVGRMDSLICCVPNFTPKLNSFESICCTLLTYNIFPRVLNLSLSSHDNLVGISSGKRRPSQLEQFFACSSVTEHLSVSLCDRLTDDVMTVTRILSGLGRCRESQLSTLKLAKVAQKTLLSIAPILTTTPCFCFKLKRLELFLFHGREMFVPLLVEILHHLTSLESLSLSFQRTSCGNLGHSLLSSLSQLFTYPNFKEMKLNYLIDFPVAGVISALLCSLANHQQSLELVQQRIAVPSHHSDLEFKLPSSQHAHHYGQKRDITFTNITASRSFYDWLFSMPTISLNTMRFTHCRVIIDGRGKLDLTEKLKAHPNASVTHFHCKNFRDVRW